MNCWQEFCTYASLSFTVRSLLDSDNLRIALRSSESPQIFLTPLRFVSIRDSAVCQLTANFDLKVMLLWQAFCPYASLSFTVRSFVDFDNLPIALRSSESSQTFLDAPTVREHTCFRSVSCCLGRHCVRMFY